MTRRVALAVLGAGPIGLEMALAAAEADIDFVVLEASEAPAGNVRDWGSVRLFTPWSMNVSPRARARLQESGCVCPDDDQCPTGQELFDLALEPISRLPEVVDRVLCGSRVVAVSRDGLLKNDEIGRPTRASRPFRILFEGPDGEDVLLADRVVDCTGTYHNPNSLGSGGIPAPGERGAAARIVRRIPDLETEAAIFDGRRILLVGGGHSAQTAAVALADRIQERPDTRVTWALRSAEPDFAPDPHDLLRARSALHAAAQEIVDHGRGIRVLPGRIVERLSSEADGVRVTLQSAPGASGRDGSDSVIGASEEVEVDVVLALTGAVGDHTLYRQLQVHECWATSGPMKLAASLLADGSADCMAQTGHGPEVLKNPEPDFYILGSKSYGRNNSFLLRVGWEQVEDVISILSAQQTIAMAGERQE